MTAICICYNTAGKAVSARRELTPVSGEPWGYTTPDGKRYLAIDGTSYAVEYPRLTRHVFDTSSVDAFFADIINGDVYISETFVKLATLCKPDIVPELQQRRSAQLADIIAEQEHKVRALEEERQAALARAERAHKEEIENAVAAFRARSGYIDNDKGMILELADIFGVPIPARTRALMKPSRLYTIRMYGGKYFVSFDAKGRQIPCSVYDTLDKIALAIGGNKHEQN